MLNAGAMRTWLVFIPVMLLAGCDLYFGDGDDTVCAGYEVPPAQSYRDPNTGTCVPGQWGWCSGCEPCATGVDVGGADPDRGLCESNCTGLDQSTCEATAGCYAAFNEQEGLDGYGFEGCWQVAPSGPVKGSCEGLDAQQCSRHDNCAIVYTSADDFNKRFAYCMNEPDYQGCAATDCAPGYHCEEQCYPREGDPTVPSYCQAACVPDGNKCAAVDCGPGTTCVETCEYDGGDTFVCDAECVPVGMDPGSCTGFVACDALPPACPSGTTPGQRDGCWTGYCIPNGACGPADPGQCYGTVTCATPSPVCPTGTTPGILNGCPTGFCIPTSDCPLSACETLTTKGACDGRNDCISVYEGTNCTCYPSGCTCETLTWDHCEAAYMPL